MSDPIEQLRITEIFHSLQGESSTVGYPTVFVRLTGCPLRCGYCDTAYAFQGGSKMTLAEIVSRVESDECKKVCVTGGEPLAQKNVYPLMTRLCDLGYQVSLETSGALDISQVDNRVMVVMDIKTPDSGEAHKNLFENLDHIKKEDQIKFVIGSRKDYEWCCSLIEKEIRLQQANVLFSPIWNTLNPSSLANWIVEDKLNVRFQLQLHKILWNDEPGH